MGLFSATKKPSGSTAYGTEKSNFSCLCGVIPRKQETASTRPESRAPNSPLNPAVSSWTLKPVRAAISFQSSTSNPMCSFPSK